MTNKSDGEIEKLKAELAKVKLERDILKKATAFIAHDVTHLHGTRFDSNHHTKDHRDDYEDWSI